MDFVYGTTLTGRCRVIRVATAGASEEGGLELFCLMQRHTFELIGRLVYP